MTTLEKTISLINSLPQKDLEAIYSYASFLAEKEKSLKENRAKKRLEVLNSKKYVVKTGRTAEDIDKMIWELRSNDRI